MTPEIIQVIQEFSRAGGAETVAVELAAAFEAMGLSNAVIAARVGADVGAEGRIKGSIAAESVDLRGNITGKVTCATLTLRSTARVEADINYSAVTIENGAEIEGRFSRPKA